MKMPRQPPDATDSVQLTKPPTPQKNQTNTCHHEILYIRGVLAAQQFIQINVAKCNNQITGTAVTYI